MVPIQVNVYEGKGSKFLVTSMEVAEKFNKEHKNVLQSIRENYFDSDWGRLNFKPSEYKNSQGKNQPCYEITKDGFSILAMGFTGEEALTWKLRFLEAFNLMEEALYKLKGKEWLAMRMEGKLMRRMVTDIIQEYIDYAISQGSETYKSRPQLAYSNFTKMEYKALFGLSKVQEDFRDSLTSMDLNCLASAEVSVSNTLRAGIDRGIYYKEIYVKAKENVEQLKVLLRPTNNIGNPFVDMLP